MTDHELIGLTYERMGECLDEIKATRKELRDHIKDDNQRFATLRARAAELADDVAETTGRHDAVTDPEAVKVVEAEKTKRWQIAAGVIAGALTLLGAALAAHSAGRASAPQGPPMSVPVPVQSR